MFWVFVNFLYLPRFFLFEMLELLWQVARLSISKAGFNKKGNQDFVGMFNAS